MIIVKRRLLSGALDYKAACQQTITLYNVWKDSSVIRYHRTVFEKSAFLEAQKLWKEQTTGTTASTNSLLVVPVGVGGGAYLPPKEFDDLPDKTGYFTMRNADKALPGIGPEVLPSNVSAVGIRWIDLLDTNYPGTIAIKQIDIKRNLAGEIVHIEAGG